MQPGDILPISFDSGLMLLSFLISVFGAYVALLAASHIRTTGTEGPGGEQAAAPRAHPGYVLVSAVALGGVGIWSMHFIGTVAQLIPFGVSYSLFFTAVSFVVAVAFSGLALWYVGSRRFTMRCCVVGGVLAGLGVAGMHYLGMYSMQMNAYFEWQGALIVASVLIAVVAATAALWLAFNLYGEAQRIVAAVLMAIAVCGMHYTGVMAGVIVCTTPRVFTGWSLDGGLLPYAVFLISAVTLIVMRVELYRTSALARQLAMRRMENVLITRSRAETD